MDFTYRSPLQDEYYEAYNQDEKGSWTRPSRPKHLSYHRDVKPYARPSVSSQVRSPTYNATPGLSDEVQPETYSSRYKSSSYPRELKDMLGATECKLCAVEVSSPIVAKMHYSGKPHMKKVKNFLSEWSLKTGNSIENFEQPTIVSTPSSVSVLPDYCELCDVRLLSTNDKIAHCSGKQHKKNERDPTNAKKKNKTYDVIDLSGTDARFGIGQDFSSDQKAVIPEIKIKDFVCELCGVKAVSQEQLDIHLGGKSHRHRLKKKESGLPNPDRPYRCNICDVALETARLLRLHLKGKPHEKRMKLLKTEFKADICEICNIEFNTHRDYQKHMNGEKHEQKCRQNPLRTTTIIKSPKATTLKNFPDIGSLDNYLCDRSPENITIKKETDGLGSWECVPCDNIVFDTKMQYEEHKNTRKHFLCTLNIEADKISEDKRHWYCFTCRKQCHGQKEYCGHLFELKHMTLSSECCDLGSKTDLFYCSVCDILMDQQTKNSHMTIKGHLVAAAQVDISRALTELATQDLGTHTFHCTHCNSTFFNFIAYSDHVLAPEHVEEIVCAKLAART